MKLEAELVAVVLAVDAGRPWVLATGEPPALPAGPLTAGQDSLQAGVRKFARGRSGFDLGYVEQLYTFADLGRSSDDRRTVSISYLGLTRASIAGSVRPTDWSPLYDLLPWEDRRHLGDDRTDRLGEELERALRRWCGESTERLDRCRFLFGYDDTPWRPDLALQRYELLWEAGLVAESPAAGRISALTAGPMLHDHRRILATGLSRIRAKLQYRPVVFELMPATFTLLALQETVEAVAGQHVHKQNFRRAVEVQHELVEPTGDVSHETGGRPAKLYRFRGSVREERAQVGTKLPLPR
ncbi:NUDIX hydrolase [Flexivirga sp.]|uniref:NUDIX hydrolase n=1 Tax=Flexivirga sp. TaxID=1962927 RepID=UPI003F7E7CAF